MNIKEYASTIKNWQSNKLKKHDCPSCNKPSWNTIFDEFSLVSKSKKTTFKFVPVICKNCGFTKFYHLDTILTQNQ